MKTTTFSNRPMQFRNHPEITPDPRDVSKALAMSNHPTGSSNIVVIARYKWLVANGAKFPEHMENPNLFITIRDGVVRSSRFLCTFGMVLQEQGLHVEVLNGPSFNTFETGNVTKEELVLRRDQGLADLCFMALDEFRDKDVSNPFFPLGFTSSDSQGNRRMLIRPSDRAVLETLREADVNHWDKNLIIIARQRWLRERKIEMPSDVSNPNLCVRIVNGQLTCCFYSPDMMNVIRKQNYFIQVLN